MVTTLEGASLPDDKLNFFLLFLHTLVLFAAIVTPLQPNPDDDHIYIYICIYGGIYTCIYIYLNI